MDELSGVKSELKKWESAFLTTQGRKPLKEDIESAGDEVVSLYKKYDKLKRTKASIPVWGKELNKSLSDLKASNPVEEETEKFRMSITRKFIGQAPITTAVSKIKKPSAHLALPSANESKENEDLESSAFPETFKKSGLKLKFNTPNGLTASAQRINSPLVAMRRSAIRNEFRISLPPVSGFLDSTSQNVVDESSQLIFPTKEKENHASHIINQDSEILSCKTNATSEANLLSSDNHVIAAAHNVSPALGSEVQILPKDDVVAKEIVKPKAKSTKRKRKGDDDDDGDKDGSDVLDNESKAKKIRLDADEEVVDRNVESAEDVQADVKFNKRNITWRKPKEEYSSKVSKDNFVKLNMKVKKYKKKGGISAISVRRQMWKQKLRLKFGGSKGGTSGSCFKCGESGHWAKNCKNKAKMKEFDWTMGSQNAQTSDQNQNAFEKIDVGQCASKALEQVSFLGDVTHEKYQPFQSLDHVEPMYELEPDGSLPEVPAEVSAALKKFGFSSFREGQKEAVMNILCGKSTLVVLSTGSGKSLCYQLPAYLYAQRSTSICLVVSPLVSLMQDQVLDLPVCLKGACIHNNMTAEQRQKVLESASDGQLHFLLLSPEMLVGGFLTGDGRGLNLPPVSFACIDEVHCLSDWSHHFRPSYLMICKVLRERFGVKSFLGLTATANKSAIASICQHFEIEQNESSVIRQAPVPRNLLVTISRDEDKEEMLIHLLKGKRFSRCQSIIVYCTRREQTSRVAVLIRTRMQNEAVADDDVVADDDNDAAKSTTKGKARKPKKVKPKKALKWDAECYHAGLTAVQRKRIQKNFMSGKLRVVVATVAFGMGLDKSDVRGIIHFNLPGTVESYIQEIGRAGRDGVESHCHLFLDPSASDLMELKRHIHAKSLDRITVKKLVQQVFKPCRCRLLHEVINEVSFANQDQEEVQKETSSYGRRICPGHERSLSIDSLVKSLDVKEEGLSTLLCYLELCPQKWIYNRHPVYSRCSIKFYSAQNEFSDLLKKCPALGMLLARQKDLLASLSTSRSIEFDVVELSDMVGSQSNLIKRQLRDLQYISDQNGCRRSGVIVEFTDLSFHFQAPGDLLDEEVDSVVDTLFDRVQGQEFAELYHLHKFYDMLKSVSYKSCFSCQDDVDKDRSLNLRSKLQNHLESGTDEVTSQECKEFIQVDEIQPAQEASLRQDIRSFINTYSGDHRITGRSIARIFHGIHSPCFPSETWSRVRRYWRSHMGVDFNLLRNIATSELTN